MTTTAGNKCNMCGATRQFVVAQNRFTCLECDRFQRVADTATPLTRPKCACGQLARKTVAADGNYYCGPCSTLTPPAATTPALAIAPTPARVACAGCGMFNARQKPDVDGFTYCRVCYNAHHAPAPTAAAPPKVTQAQPPRCACGKIAKAVASPDGRHYCGPCAASSQQLIALPTVASQPSQTRKSPANVGVAGGRPSCVDCGGIASHRSVADDKFRCASCVKEGAAVERALTEQKLAQQQQQKQQCPICERRVRQNGVLMSPSGQSYCEPCYRNAVVGNPRKVWNQGAAGTSPATRQLPLAPPPAVASRRAQSVPALAKRS